MLKRSLITSIFYAAAVYDGLLGVVFLTLPGAVFDWYGVTPPNHMGYVHFPALLLLLFSVMFVQIALDPVRNRNLIPYGIGLKVSYSAVVFWHWFLSGIPGMWKPFAVIDAVTAALFLWAYVVLKKNAG